MSKWNKERLTVSESFNNWLVGNGIFTAMMGQFNTPWADYIDGVTLDMEYFGNIAGDKYISNLIYKISKNQPLETTQIVEMSNLIYKMYKKQWEKEWETLLFDYNPIENYGMTEQMTDDETVDVYGKTNTRTENLSHIKSGSESTTYGHTDTRTDNLTETRNLTTTRTDNLTEDVENENSETNTPSITNTKTTQIAGFNGGLVDSEKTTDIESGTNRNVVSGTTTKTNTGTQTSGESGTVGNAGTQTSAESGTDTHQYNALTDTDTGTVGSVDGGQDTHTRNYTLTRSGNIGVTTSQQMIESERELWMWNFFYNVVFPDVNKVLALSIY